MNRSLSSLVDCAAISFPEPSICSSLFVAEMDAISLWNSIPYRRRPKARRVYGSCEARVRLLH